MGDVNYPPLMRGIPRLEVGGFGSVELLFSCLRGVKFTG